MTTLPKAAWTQRDELASLVSALGEGKIRWVGGAVRDTLLGAQVSDVDAATPLPPEEVIAACTRAGIRTAPTGIEHGTVTAIFPHCNIEVTTLRKDVETDGRRATIAYAAEWQEDAARRDFTINALYADPRTLEIFDYFGGVADLEARRVRFIGDSRQRIREDYLRLLRYFRFQARFGAELDAAAEDACRELAEGLRGLSRERVGWELLTLLGLPDPADTVERMRQLGVLQVVLPESGPREIEQLCMLIAAEASAGVEPDAIRRLAALLPALQPVAESVAARLRLSRKQRARLERAAAREPHDAEHARALAYIEGRTSAVDRLLLTGASIEAIAGWQAPEFPLKGGDLVAAGLTAGPQVARRLQALEREWIARGFPSADKQAIMEWEVKDR